MSVLFDLPRPVRFLFLSQLWYLPGRMLCRQSASGEQIGFPLAAPGAYRSEIPMMQLVWPIMVENILRISLMSVDTFMLSRYSEKAVAAMSLVNQFCFFIMLIYTMVSMGASILIAQNLGAKRPREAGLTGVGSLLLVTFVGILLSMGVMIGIGPVLSLYELDPLVADYAVQFMMIFGGLSFFQALNIAQSSVIRAWGRSKEPMIVNTAALLVTVGGNALCLFGPFGLPVLGVRGVAVSTVLGQVVACVCFIVIIRRGKDIELPLKELLRIPRSVYKSVLAVGIPTAGENLAYNVSQIAILSMIAHMGTEALTTYGILLAVLRYVFIPGVCIGVGTQIKVGWLVGAGLYDEAARKVYGYLGIGIAFSVGLIVILGLFFEPVLKLFSSDPKVIALAASVYIIAAIHEPARNFNTIVIPALKGSGDVRFPVYVGMVSMFGISVLFAWILGIHLGLGLAGAWIGMAMDEWIRGLIMIGRWRSGAWKSKSFVKA
jgi:putative MATE family efflux protein